MGLPATAFLANNGRHQPYPFYVWLADHPDGPMWRLMDRAFEEWDARTGEHLAFFVDPFQKREWAEDFLRMVGADPGLAHEILGATASARQFYRERLSTNLAHHFRIGREFLPAAIVSLAWDAPSAAVCFLRNETDLPRLFHTLIDLDQSDSSRRFLDRGGPPGPSFEEPRRRLETSFSDTQRLAKMLDDKFDVQTYEFPRPLSRAIETALQPESVRYFVEQLRSEAARNHWVLGVDDPRHARGLGASKAYVALASLDDLVAVAMEIGALVGRVAERYSGDADAEALRRHVRRLREIQDQIAGLSEGIKRAAESGDDRAIIAAFDEFERGAREFDLVRHLIGVLGPKTFAALQPDSRDAVAASELIYLISRRLADLRRDLTAVLVGYWKASEREGRRVLVELLSRRFRVAYESKGTIATISRRDVDDLTLGSLRVVFGGLKLDPSDRAPSLPTQALATLLKEVTVRIRNPYTHRELLNDLTKLEHARNLMGCKNPIGVLPLLTAALEAIDPTLVPDVSDEAELPSSQDLGFLGSDGVGPARPVKPTQAARPMPVARRDLPVGTIGEWVVADVRTMKGKPVFRLAGGTIQGVLHPRSATPPDLDPGKTFRMRVVTGGNMHQIEWIQSAR